MKSKIEKVQITGFDLEEIFSEEFLKKLKELDDFFPTTVAFFMDGDEKKGKNATHIVMNIQNSVERKQKIIHIESSDSEILKKFLDKLK